MRRWIVRALVALLLTMAATPASAHARLLETSPPIGASLAQAPDELMLTFSEALDPAFVSIQLFDARNRAVAIGAPIIELEQPTLLRVALSPLAPGAYTALWRVRSIVDGHVTEGSLPFGVGAPAPQTWLIPPPGAPDPATLLPAPLEAAARWLSMLALALALGPLLFALLVWRPELLQAPEPWPDADRRLARTLGRVSAAGAWLTAGATMLLLLAQAMAAAQVSLGQALTPLVGLVSGTGGWLWIVRVGLAAALGLLASGLRSPTESLGRWWAALGLGGALLVTFSLTSHGAANGDPAAVALDLVHRVAMVVWLGGLAPLALTIQAARQAGAPAALARFVPRFSRLAIGATIALALSGAYAGVVYVGDPALLAATTYGRALALKLALFGALLLVGTVNLRLITPRLGGAGAHRLARSVSVELLLGAGVLLAAGTMTSIAPARTAWEEHERQGIAQHMASGNVDLTLRLAPARIGENQFAVDVIDRRPGAAETPTRVLLRFGMIGMEMGELEAEAMPGGLPNRYEARGSYLAMGGRWQIDVILRRAGFEDIEHTFTVDVTRDGT